MSVTSICSVCGNEFRHSSSKNRVTCSLECRIKYWESLWTKKICPVCNIEFKSLKSRNSVVCSNKCKHKLLDKSEIIVCLNCKKPFKVAPSELKKGKKYCSKKCFDIAQTGENHPNWRGGHRVTSLQWAYRNPEYMAYMASKRRAMLKGVEGSHTFEEWKEVLEKHNYKCAYCGGTERLSKDHIIPISKNGTDYIENIQVLCLSCNSSKGNKLEDEIDFSTFFKEREYVFPTEGKLAVRVQFLDGDF